MRKRNTTDDVIMIGAGIMSATLGTMLKEVDPEMKVTIFEQLDQPGQESSNEWNNSGTGHAALCELNYTSEKPDGSMDISKAKRINEQFLVSRQFWSHLVNMDQLQNPEEFIRPLPHMSLVHGEDNVNFLRKRYEALKANAQFADMEFSDNPEKLKEWIPLIMNGRTVDHPMAATRVDTGTDVNFGVLTRKLVNQLEEKDVAVKYNRTVEDLKKQRDGSWEIKVRNFADDTLEYHTAKFVFIGAGGGALPLLQKTGIPESKHYGGFPVSGLFMVCNNPNVIEQLHAKVYGKAAVGAPPMSVPHLDTRYINGRKSILFGPFAGFSPKFLKSGSNMDLVGSVKPNNVMTMLAAGAKNFPLTKYLLQQLLLSNDQRMTQLREFVPEAKVEDWDVVVAGQRVQVIKDTDNGGKGTLQFGTEIVNSQDGSVAALLGASPGASTAVPIMLDIFKRCFPEQLNDWEPKIREMIPSYGKALADDADMIRDTLKKTGNTLKLDEREKAEQK